MSTHASANNQILAAQETRLQSEVNDDQDELIKQFLIKKGEKCSICKHAVMALHDKDGSCRVQGCGCKRARKKVRRGMSLFELFDLEAGGWN